MDSPSPDRKRNHNMEVHNSQCLIIYESPSTCDRQTCISSKCTWRTVINTVNAFWNSISSLRCSPSPRPSTKKSSMNIMPGDTWKSKVYGGPMINKRENIHKNTNKHGNQRPLGLWSRKPVTQWKKKGRTGNGNDALFVVRLTGKYQNTQQVFFCSPHFFPLQDFMRYKGTKCPRLQCVYFSHFAKGAHGQC